MPFRDFPDYAKALLDLLDGKVEKKSDSFDIRIWEVTISSEPFCLTFDDFPVMVSLEYLTPKGDLLLAALKNKLI